MSLEFCSYLIGYSSNLHEIGAYGKKRQNSTTCMLDVEVKSVIYIIKNVLQVDKRVIGLKLLKIDVIHDILSI